MKRSRIIRPLPKIKIISIFLYLFFSAILGPQTSFSDDMFSKDRFFDQDEPWKITAKTMSLRDKEKIYDAEGDVVISSGDQVLRAQKASYNMSTGIAEVYGDIRLESGGDVFTGEMGVFDLNGQTGRITNGSLFLKDNNFYIKGDLMEKLDENIYRVKDCQVTTCDGPDPAWSITGSEVKVTVEGYGTVKHAKLRIRDVPILYVPYMIFPAKTQRQTGLLSPIYGHSSRNGSEFEIPFFWAISEQTDATFYQRYMTRRGYMQGLEFRYIAGKASRGAFLLDVLSDREDKDLNDPDDVALSPFSRTNQTRYWFRGRMDHNLPNGIVARLDADYISDQDYLNEFEGGRGFGIEARHDLMDVAFRPIEEKRSPLRTSALRVSRDTDEYSLQALTSYHQLPGNPVRDQTAQPLGSLMFSLLPANVLDIPVFLDFESEYDYVWRDVGQKGHSLTLSPGLRVPLRFARYLEFEPFMCYELTSQRYGLSHGDEDEQILNAYELGAKMSTSLDRVYDFEFKDIKKLKHRIRPTLSYTHRGYRDEDEQSPWFETIEEDGDANLVTLSIENFLNARMEDKEGNISYRQCGKLMLSQSYNLEEKRRGSDPGVDREPFEPLCAELILRPGPNLDLYAEAKWDHYDQEITFVDLSLDFILGRSGGRKDRFSADYQYDKVINSESINFWFDVNLNYGLSAGSAVSRDLNFDQNITNRYWLQYQRQCWGFKLIAEDENNETSVMLEFQLLGLGAIGLN